MVGVLLISGVFDSIDERDKVLVSDRKLFKQAVLLEQFETEVGQDVFAQRLTVLKHVEVPLLEVVHVLEDLRPLPRAHVNELSQSLFIFLDLVLVWLTILAMKLFEEVIEISLEPCRCVIRLLRRNVDPSLGFHVLLSLAVLIHRKLVQFVGLNDRGHKLRLLFNRI